MHIKITKNYLSFDDYKVKCSVGKRGIGHKVREGDFITPKGSFKIKYILYRKDRIKKIQSRIKKIIIKKNMGWCNSVTDKKYNKEINIIKKKGFEKLYRKDHKYDAFIVIKYNLPKPVPGKGSAIFIHLTRNYKPTAGCIALNIKNFLILAKFCNKKTSIKI